jgi:O-antigen ligase
MTMPTQPSWDQPRFGESSQDAPAATRGNRRTGVDTFNFAMAVTWFVLLLSSVMQWANYVTEANTFYPFVTLFVAYFLLFRVRDLLKVLSYFQFWVWAGTVLFAIVLYQAGGGDEWARVSMRQRIVNFSSLAGTALILLDPERKRILRTAGLITLGFSIPMLFFELVVPNVFSTAPGRSAGFYQNPNDACAGLLLCLLFVIDLRRPTTRSLMLVSLVFAAIVTTFSRQGLLFGALLWLYYGLIARGRGGLSSGKRVFVFVGLVMALLIGGFIVSQQVEFSDEALMRFYSIVRGDVSDRAALGRLDKAQASLDAVLQSPWTGLGLGAVERYRFVPHNTFLYIGVDYGIGGVLVFTFILLFNLARSMLAGWERGSTSIAVSLLLIYTSAFTHYVHSTNFFAVAFGALIVDALIEPKRPRRPVASPSEPLAESYGLRPT